MNPSDKELFGEEVLAEIVEASDAAFRNIGAYRLTDCLQRRAEYQSHLAVDDRLNRKVVVKSVCAGQPVHPDFQRQVDGARAISSRRDLSISSVYDVGREPVCYFARSFVDGQSLASLAAETTQDEKFDILQLVVGKLADLHRDELAHGNLTAPNIFITADREVVFTDFAAGDPQQSAPGDVRAVGYLILNWLTVSKTSASDSHDSGAQMSSPLSDLIYELGVRATAYIGRGSTHALEEIQRYLASQCKSPRAAARPATGNIGRRVRGGLMLAAGVCVLLLGGLLTLASFVMIAFIVGLEQAGPVLQMMVITVGPLLVIGSALVHIGLRNVQHRRSSRPANTQLPEQPAVRPQPIPSQALRPTEEFNVSDASTIDAPAAQRDSQPKGFVYPKPTNEAVSLALTGQDIVMSRRVGTRVGVGMMCASMVSFGTSFVVVAAYADWSTERSSSAAMSMFLVIAIAMVCTAVLVFRFMLRTAPPATIHPADSGLTRLLKKGRFWFGEEKLSCRSDGVEVATRDQASTTTTVVPWNEIWDIKPGQIESGVEMATLGSPIRFAVGAPANVRGWFAERLNYLKQRFAAGNPSAEAPSSDVDAQSALQSVLDVEATSSRRGTVSLPLWFQLLRWIGLTVVPPVMVTEVAADFFSPNLFEEDTWFAILEIGVNSICYVMIGVTGVMMFIGLQRAGVLRRSGLSLIRAAFWTRVTCLALLFMFVSYLQSQGVEMPETATMAINISTLACSFILTYEIVLVVALQFTSDTIKWQPG